MISQVHIDEGDVVINARGRALRTPWCVCLPVLLYLIQCHLGLSRGHNGHGIVLPFRRSAGLRAMTMFL